MSNNRLWSFVSRIKYIFSNMFEILSHFLKKASGMAVRVLNIVQVSRLITAVKSIKTLTWVKAGIITLCIVPIALNVTYKTRALMLIHAERQNDVSIVNAVQSSADIINREIRFHGRVVGEVVVMKSEVDGKVLSVNVKPGDYVRKNSLLIRLDNRKEIALYDEAMAKLAAAQFNYETLTRLKKDNSASIPELEYVKAKTEFDAAYHTAEFRKLSCEQYEVKAPVDGYVSITNSENILPGSYIYRTGELLTVIGDVGVMVDAYISEKEVSKVHIGDLVTIIDVTSNDTDKPLAYGEIIVIDRLSDVKSHSVLVRIKVTSNQERLITKQTVVGNIKLQDTLPSVTVPESALLPIDENNEYCVYVIESNSIVRRTPVKITGTRDKGYAEIISGIGPDQLVVMSPTLRIRDGEKVTINETVVMPTKMTASN